MSDSRGELRARVTLEIGIMPAESTEFNEATAIELSASEMVADIKDEISPAMMVAQYALLRFDLPSADGSSTTLINIVADVVRFEELSGGTVYRVYFYFEPQLLFPHTRRLLEEYTKLEIERNKTRVPAKAKSKPKTKAKSKRSAKLAHHAQLPVVARERKPVPLLSFGVTLFRRIFGTGTRWNHRSGPYSALKYPLPEFHPIVRLHKIMRQSRSTSPFNF